MNKVSSSDGTSIAFDRTGEGRPVILVGGGSGLLAAVRAGGLRQRTHPRDRRWGELRLDARHGTGARGHHPGWQHRTLEGQTHDVAPEILAPVLRNSFWLCDSDHELPADVATLDLRERISCLLQVEDLG